MRVLTVVVLLAVVTGCQSPHPDNPSFRITKAEAEQALRAMEADPRPLARPLIFVSGWRDPAAGAWWLSVHYEKLVDDERMLNVGYANAKDIESARAIVIDAVDEAFPSADPRWTVPVDVVGISMGGLVARYAAMPSRLDPETRQLNIVRLFSLASPQRGAMTADELNIGDELMEGMRTDSEFITWINAADVGRSYELIAYVRLGDDVVGTANAAPVGEVPWWLPNPALEHAHIGGTLDVRFMADIARRLRDEPPFATPPPAPIPVVDP